MKMRAFLGFFLLWMVALGCAGLRAQPKGVVDVVLLGGQSNMAGAGNFDQLPASVLCRLQKCPERVSLSNQGGEIEPLSYYIGEPLKIKKYGFEKFFGPELMIGITLAEHYPQRRFLLVKTAYGGTSLYGAWNPNWSAQKSLATEKGKEKQNKKLFLEHVSHIETSIHNLQLQGDSCRIIGMFWMQGENDAAKEVSANSYEANLRLLIKAYRRTFGLPEMPFVLGQINSTYGRYPQGPAVVREAMVKVAESTPYCGIVRTSTDPSWSDFPKHKNVHYNTEGQIRLGKAMADKFLGLVNAPL